MIEVGRLIVKLAGRDAGLKGVIVEILEKGHILIDGQVRRRKCNILHIEPLDKVIKLPKKASHEEVVKALKAEGIEVKEKKKKSKEKADKPRKVRREKEKPAAEKKEVKPKKEVKEKKQKK
ncbi:50S ribosomal protein L14e [Candidatus Woesearchaeota archaeon B3_Woes]|nr:MAG: 50S ribosomal protein L14e [Candidatus Woesearchaeota archaeon B3_Woes]